MKLKVEPCETRKHEAVVVEVKWAEGSGLYSLGDDQKIFNWGLNGGFQEEFASLELHPTCFCARNDGTKTSVVVGTSEGRMLTLNSSGRVEKEVEAHLGAVTKVSWSKDGTSICTAGEDATVKVWSATATFRFTIEKADKVITSLTWINNNTVMFSSGNLIFIHSLDQVQDSRAWQAHAGSILQADYNETFCLVISSGEDRKFKIWNDHGLLLYTSQQFAFPFYSLQWSPLGTFLGIANNEFVLGDHTGRIISRLNVPECTAVDAAWNRDGSHFAVAGADGNIYFGEIVNRKAIWHNLEAFLNEDGRIVVTDIHENRVVETLDPDGRSVVNMSLAFNFLVVATTSHVYIWEIPRSSTPVLIDIASPVIGILQTDCYCALLTSDRSLLIYEYDGRSQAQPNTSQFTSRLSTETVAGNSELLAVVNYTNKEILFLNPYDSSEKIVDTFKHQNEIKSIQISQTMSNDDSLILFIDQNLDLHIFSIMKQKPKKISTMVASCMWHSTYPILLTFSSNRLTTWFHPRSALWTNMDLTKRASKAIENAGIGRDPKLLSWHDSTLSIERNDGTIVHLMISPHVLLLQQCQNDLQAALKLCRSVDDSSMWAYLACMAIESNESFVAMQAMKALNIPSNLFFLQRVSRLQSDTIRNAELTAFRGEIVEAERILINKQLISEVISLDIRIGCWERALQNALNYNKLVKEVLATRKNFLESVGQTEIYQLFIDSSKKYELSGEEELFQQQSIYRDDALSKVHKLLFEATEV